MDAQPPKPPLVAKLTPEEQSKLDAIHRNRFNKPAYEEPLKVENYGPIKSMILGADWKDLGIWPQPKDLRNKSAGNPFKHHDYRLVDSQNTGTIRLPYHPKSDSDARAENVKALVDTISGPVPEAKWSDLDGVFGSAANPQFFTVKSVEVIELNGKKIITMTGIHKSSNSWEKNVYVSLAGNWRKYYEFGMGSSPDKQIFEKEAAKFDKALKTVIWRNE